MKELRVLLIIYFSIILLVACTKVANTPAPIELGKESTSTAITNLSTTITTGQVDVTMNVTLGAKYSIQLIDLKGDVKYVIGFTADNNLVTKQLDYSDVKSGDYTIVLLDISGNEYKRNLTIKK